MVAFARYFRDLRTASRGDPAIGPQEQQLEDALRRAGLNPVPQYPVGPYRLDLAIVDGPVPIDIEVDGVRYHLERDGTRIRADLGRDAYLRARGWKVKRFWAVEVRDRVDDCVRRIREIAERRRRVEPASSEHTS
jgi:very-short-patch-repair endonuclease